MHLDIEKICECLNEFSMNDDLNVVRFFTYIYSMASEDLECTELLLPYFVWCRQGVALSELMESSKMRTIRVTY